jgi:Icc-related predicted phosphoesterase
MSKKYKILAAGDIHGDVTLVRKLVDKAEKENVDLVVLCGDLTMSEASTENIIGPFINKNKKVLLIPGNHESIATIDFLAELYGATNLHGYSFKLGDIGLFGCSGVNIGIHKLPESEIFELLNKAYNQIKEKRTKIMVTHVHPDGIKMGKLTPHFQGSKGVRKALDYFKPDIILCSHVHEAEGVEEIVGSTKIINVGRSGKIVEI